MNKFKIKIFRNDDDEVAIKNKLRRDQIQQIVGTIPCRLVMKF
jgi:hypothetical protein